MRAGGDAPSPHPPLPDEAECQRCPDNEVSTMSWNLTQECVRHVKCRHGTPSVRQSCARRAACGGSAGIDSVQARQLPIRSSFQISEFSKSAARGDPNMATEGTSGRVIRFAVFEMDLAARELRTSGSKIHVIQNWTSVFENGEGL